MGYVRGGRFQDTSGSVKGGRNPRGKGTPTVWWQAALAGTSTGSGSQSGIEAGIGVGVPNALAARRAGSRGAGGDGAWSGSPARGRWRSPSGASAHRPGPAGGHIPVTMRPSRQGVRLGVARTIVIIVRLPGLLERRRDFLVKTDLPPRYTPSWNCTASEGDRPGWRSSEAGNQSIRPRFLASM